ncbi:EthD family reductase [Sandaracinomonas limnophila]|uniref:EthD family reductase n=1 Tax=Sandaracinomonas limnophila TaxID=1862386 RepID=A0A437PPE6_9BACT|nr:EthD family reductase [Sandaracinomonas limnophila]RVU24140.1 EthD family reductase [Sandaracinomonas limnophila]
MKTKLIGILTAVFVMMVQVSFAQNASSTPKITKGMIKVGIYYPKGEGKTFNMDYYVNKHMTLAKSLLGNSLKAVEIDKGLASGVPNTPLPYVAIGYLYFDSLDSFQKAMNAEVSAKLNADVPNYTNSIPIVQISEVLL